MLLIKQVSYQIHCLETASGADETLFQTVLLQFELERLLINVLFIDVDD